MYQSGTKIMLISSYFKKGSCKEFQIGLLHTKSAKLSTASVDLTWSVPSTGRDSYRGQPGFIL